MCPSSKQMDCIQSGSADNINMTFVCPWGKRMDVIQSGSACNMNMTFMFPSSKLVDSIQLVSVDALGRQSPRSQVCHQLHKWFSSCRRHCTSHSQILVPLSERILAVCLSVCVRVCLCLCGCVADVKKPGAGRHSQYYRKHGNPNFGGESICEISVTWCLVRHCMV